MSQLLRIKNLVRAGAIALALGAFALGAMPAQAAHMHPYFARPHIFLHPFFGGYPYYPQPYYPYYPYYPGNVCMSDWQVVSAIQHAGYYNVFLLSSGGDYAEVRAYRAGHLYVIGFDRCSGNIVNVRRG